MSGDEFEQMAEEIVAMHDTTDEVSECGYACAWVEPYGWVPEADCPVHDAPIIVDPLSDQRPSSGSERGANE